MKIREQCKQAYYHKRSTAQRLIFSLRRNVSDLHKFNIDSIYQNHYIEIVCNKNPVSAERGKISSSFFEVSFKMD